MGDIELNVSKKVTTNYQTAENLSPPARMNLEEVLSYIEDDEQVEPVQDRFCVSFAVAFFGILSLKSVVTILKPILISFNSTIFYISNK